LVILETLANEIVDPAASRVFERLPFEYGHDAPLCGVVPASAEVEMVDPRIDDTVKRTTIRTALRPNGFLIRFLLSWTGQKPLRYFQSCF
jgi:hypothetical protein